MKEYLMDKYITEMNTDKVMDEVGKFFVVTIPSDPVFTDLNNFIEEHTIFSFASARLEQKQVKSIFKNRGKAMKYAKKLQSEIAHATYR